MKVKKTKKKVNANSNPNVGVPLTQVSSNLAVQNGPREEAKSYIQSAIGALSNIANDDPIAKESIANLAVVLMDLQ